MREKWDKAPVEAEYKKRTIKRNKRMRTGKKSKLLSAFLAFVIGITLITEKYDVHAEENDGNTVETVEATVIETTEGTDETADSELLTEETVDEKSTDKEFRAVWIAYYDFDDSKGMDKEAFTAYVGEMFDNVADIGMNAVMVHVRAFSDAMYKSKYYPWSVYASGQQGVSPGYDPLKIMVKEAHARGLEIHAWLNPYRVTSSWNGGTDVTKLSKKNPARKWLTNKKTSDDRYVLSYGSALYYNPSISAVRKLIVNGVKEIVENYDVDGIHFDDYFYPDLGNNYETNFDAPEYEKYKKKAAASGEKPMSIADWRKNNVNLLVKAVYKAVKSIDPDVTFGISPGGYIDYFDEDFRWYVDYRTWMSEKGYIDYICPQLYWSFNSRNIFPFYETLIRWCAAATNENVRVYAGLPAYKMNENNNVSSLDRITDTEFYNQYLIADMVHYIRKNDRASGFIVFDYEDLVKAKNAEMTEKLKEEIGS